MTIRAALSRSGPWISGPANGIAEMIVATREVFSVDVDIMQVLRRIPSTMGRHHDVVLIRSYQPPSWNPAPFVEAIQFRTLEDMVEQGAVSFPMGLGQASREFTADWPPAALHALAGCITTPSH